MTKTNARSARLALAALLTATGCSATQTSTTTVAPSASPATGGLARFHGRWRFDVETSLQRCERLAAHDCRTWAALPEAERVARRAQYRADFATGEGGRPTGPGRVIFAGTAATFDHFLGNDNTHTGQVSVARDEGQRVTLTLSAEGRSAPLAFEFVDAQHVCIVEMAPTADVLCLERLPAGQN